MPTLDSNEELDKLLLKARTDEYGDSGNYNEEKLKRLILADREAAIREAQIDELRRLIPEPVAEMASIDHEDELKRLFNDIRDRIASLNQPTKEGE